jgi:hypothetical protein
LSHSDLYEHGNKPCRIIGNQVYIDGVPIQQPIESGSISVKPWHGRFNLLTLTMVVGEVAMEAPNPPQGPPEVDDSVPPYLTPTANGA